jgi:hypothetical protein
MTNGHARAAKTKPCRLRIRTTTLSAESPGSHKREKNSNSGTTPFPRRASASAPPNGRKQGGGQCGQHWTRVATRKDASNCAPDQLETHVYQRARPQEQQKLQPKGHSRQEPSRQQHKQSVDKRTRSRKGLGASAHRSCRQPQGQKSQHAVPGALARLRQRHQKKDPRDQATNQ